MGFSELKIPLAVTAVDLERGRKLVLSECSVLAAVRATCAVPGMLSPERLAGRGLVDGGLINVLPVDVAWAAVEAGRLAAEKALPALRSLLSTAGPPRSYDPQLRVQFDPVCGMAISPTHARASSHFGAIEYYFCSTNCLDCFDRDPQRYLDP